MSTRAGSATASLRAKQNLVRLLFQNHSATNGTSTTGSSRGSPLISPASLTSSTSSLPWKNAATAAAAASYSYYDLRTAYLQKVQELHPDKHYCRHPTSPSSSPTVPPPPTPLPLQKSLFQQVQEAWKLFDSFAKHSNQCLASSSSSSMSKSKSSSRPATASDSDSTEPHHQRHHQHSSSYEQEANFTMFGVGCSFADTEQERHYRNYIMDQASRGYFTTGEISSRHHHNDDPITRTIATTTGSHHHRNNTTSHQYHRSCTTNATSMSLCHDDLFDASSAATTSASSHHQKRVTSSLVSHLIPPHRRASHHHHPHHSTALKKAF